LEALDYIKLAIVAVLTCLVAPAYGFKIRHRPNWQRGTFVVMCFTIISGFFNAAEWGFTVHPILYRGTARGFHFFWTEFAAVALLWAQMLGNWKDFKFFPPGFWLWILYCCASLLSFFNAPSLLEASFAAVKAFKMIVVFVAAFNFVKTQEDLRFVLKTLAWVMVWELIAVLKQKYFDHVYQVWGTFEHQNSLCMFSILIGMVFLAVAMGPKHKSSNFFLFAYLVCAAIVQSSLSRGGLIIFAAGTSLVILASLIDRVTRRRVKVIVGLGCIGVLGLTLAMDTIIKRFNDYGNEESKKTRDMLNISARMMLRDYWMGIGWNNFAETINKPYPYGDHIDHWQEMNGNPVDPTYKKGVVESLWFLLLAETGYPGFATYILLIFMFLWYALRNAIFFRHHYLGAVSMGIFFGSVMNYFQSFLERVLTQPRNMMLWFILLAVTARLNVWRKAEKKRRLLAARERRIIKRRLLQGIPQNQPQPLAA
jgi:hypothetical protein